MAQIDFGGTMEEVMTSDEFSLQKAREVLEPETVAVLGYGVQGPGRAEHAGQRYPGDRRPT